MFPILVNSGDEISQPNLDQMNDFGAYIKVSRTNYGWREDFKSRVAQVCMYVRGVQLIWVCNILYRIWVLCGVRCTVGSMM